jgi:DNA-binding transcriptional regulator YiaG
MTPRSKPIKYPRMPPGEYVAARKRLELSNYAFRKLLGISLRQAQRYESAEAEIPELTARFIRTFTRNKLEVGEIG